MAKKSKEEKIRVHNKGSRIFEYRNEKGEIKKIESGRAVEIVEKKALQMIADYPRELINFEDMLSGDRKDIHKENKGLKKEVSTLEAENAKLSEQIKALLDGDKDKKDPEPNIEDKKAPESDKGGE